MTSEAAQLALLRHPIGGPRKADSFTAQERASAIEGIALLPQKLRLAVSGFSPEQFATPYRPDGWTVRQLIHHVADSHMNAYSRVRLGLTQDWPTIFAYAEDRWAELEDARSEAVASSLDLLQALHARWVMLFRSLSDEQWKRGYVHPENGRQTVEQAVMIYDWHGRHHTAHITGLTERMGW
jgi:DinB family protein